MVDGMAAFFAWHRRFLEYLGEDLASKKLHLGLGLAWLGLGLKLRKHSSFYFFLFFRSFS